MKAVSEAETQTREKKKGIHTKLDIDVMAELYKLKRELGLKTYSDVIKILIEKYRGEKK